MFCCCVGCKGKRQVKNVFAAGFEFSEGDKQSFQWEMNEALEMATKTQVYIHVHICMSHS